MKAHTLRMITTLLEGDNTVNEETMMLVLHSCCIPGVRAAEANERLTQYMQEGYS